ncbi:MAG: hypothetical protein P8P42_07140 [Gammaproteobacteria bacterium]|nr:hypothetical protein [Gammaproteobacteria bacterium]MDG2119505.1 hypothetical protein [Gammaproteobacteria bacterium]
MLDSKARNFLFIYLFLSWSCLGFSDTRITAGPHIGYTYDDALVGEKQGSSPGDPSSKRGWELGSPDLIVKLATPYSIPKGDSDVFRNFVIPNVTASDRYVRGLEFKLDDYRLVHHAEFRVDETEVSLQRDDADPVTGYAGMSNVTAQYPDGHFINWVPGKRASYLPNDLAWRLPAGADLVVQLHMMPTDSEGMVDPEIALYFADTPPELRPRMLWLGSRWLPISAGETRFSVRDSFKLPIDVEVLSVLPHCHFICKTVEAWAIQPDGSQMWLARVEEWDFYSQQETRFIQPLRLPRGTNILVEFGYDNSIENERNPNFPPVDIKFGPLSSNEMADFWIQVLTQNEDAGERISQSSAIHLQKRIIEHQERQVELMPDVNGYIELARSHRILNELNRTARLESSASQESR